MASYDPKQQEQIERLTVERNAMLKALAFYAEPTNHAPTQTAHPASVCAEDGGRIARAVLGISHNDEERAVAELRLAQRA